MAPALHAGFLVWPRKRPTSFLPAFLPAKIDCRMTDVQSVSSKARGQAQAPTAAAAFERARGHARIGFVSLAGTTRLKTNFQSGSAKIRLPRCCVSAAKEAVLLNTAGGLTGGDHLVYEVDAGPGSRAIVTTQAAERVYRSVAGDARVETQLTVDRGARLDWLPQETIVFDNSALSRRLDVDVAADATLLAVEAIVLGRRAMGERPLNVRVNDGWRIRRAGRLIFADGIRLAGNAETIMSGGATGGGATALATLILVAPNAEMYLDAARDVLAACRGEGGASGWNRMLVARLAAPDGTTLRDDLVTLVERLRDAAMPRVWNC